MDKIWQLHPKDDIPIKSTISPEVIKRTAVVLAAFNAGFKIYEWKNRGLITLVGEPRNMSAFLLTRPDIDSYDIRESQFPSPFESTLAEDITNELHKYTSRNTSTSSRTRGTYGIISC